MMKINKIGWVLPTLGAMMNFNDQDRQCVVILSAAKDLPIERDPSLRSG